MEMPVFYFILFIIIIIIIIIIVVVVFVVVAGINNIEWDAVELPSQFMENW